MDVIGGNPRGDILFFFFWPVFQGNSVWFLIGGKLPGLFIVRDWTAFTFTFSRRFLLSALLSAGQGSVSGGEGLCVCLGGGGCVSRGWGRVSWVDRRRSVMFFSDLCSGRSPLSLYNFVMFFLRQFPGFRGKHIRRQWLHAFR